MKHINFLRVAALGVVAVFSIGAAQAATISGSLNFGGQAIPVPGPDLSDATGLDFASGILVTSATDDFAADGIGFGTSGSIANFSFASLPVDPFIQVGSFTFVLNSVQIDDQQDLFLVLSGTGVLSAAGFDDTAYDLSLSVDSSGGPFAFSATLAPTVIPIPGALVLFASGLAALGIRRRS